MPEARGAIRRIAAERIEILYEAAIKAYPSDEKLSRDYIKLLLEIGRHYKVKIPPEMAAYICKECGLPLMEGKNAEVRIIAREKRRIVRCRSCGSTNSMPFRQQATERISRK